MSEKTIEIEENETYTIVKTPIKFDATITSEFKQKLIILYSTGVSNFIIDMNNTEYCDASGLSTLLVANRLSRTSNGVCFVVNRQKAVKELFTVSQLEQVFSFCDNVPDAVSLITTKNN